LLIGITSAGGRSPPATSMARVAIKVDLGAALDLTDE
jgi:hypothetical protein